VIAYVDSSVLLRVVLGEPGRLPSWQSIETGVCSALVEVECLRTLDRLRHQGALSLEDVATRRATVFELLEGVELVAVTRPVLRRAADPFPTPLGTLDAIHLATALQWADYRSRQPVLATHDGELALAARACGLKVIGV